MNVQNLTHTEAEVQDCAVCLQKCHYPTQLPCGHIFCFLCVKGVALQSKKCAMCRAEIPADYLDHPILLKKLAPELIDPNPSDGYQWYYEGRNGWWKYDERSNSELEAAFTSGEGECKLLLAGALYVIDFQNMIQVQSRDHSRRRRVKRDTPTLPAKGIAGIKIMDTRAREQAKSDNEENSNEDAQGEVIEIADDSDVQHSEVDNIEIGTSPNNGLSDILQRISSIDLQGQDGNNIEENAAVEET